MSVIVEGDVSQWSGEVDAQIPSHAYQIGLGACDAQLRGELRCIACCQTKLIGDAHLSRHSLSHCA